MSLTCGLLIVFVLDGVVSTSARRSASRTVYPVAGVVSLLLAAALWRRRAHERPTAGRGQQVQRRRGDGHDGGQDGNGTGRSRTSQVLAYGSAKAAFAVGLVLNLPGIWYLVAPTTSPRPTTGPPSGCS